MTSWYGSKKDGRSPGTVDRLWFVSPRSVLSLFMTAWVLMGAGRGCADMRDTDINAVSTIPQGLSIYALSRGTGVPEEARKVLEESKILLKKAEEQGTVTRLIERRIGLEGETQLCAEFRDAESSREIFSHIRNISQGVDLLNVKVESCPP